MALAGYGNRRRRVLACRANVILIGNRVVHTLGKRMRSSTVVERNRRSRRDCVTRIRLIPNADNGDRYRSAAARITAGPLSIGLNLFTGNPGVLHSDRRTFNDPEANNRETYMINENGDDPDQYRAGILYVGLGPVRLGVNSENIRHFFQNRFAHDFLCRGDSPYFKVLNRPGQGYFYFGTGTGSNLW